MDDIDPESLGIYRQMLKDEKPGHPYLEQDDLTFLSSYVAGDETVKLENQALP